MNSFRPSLSGSVLVIREPLTSRNGSMMTPGLLPHEAAVGEAAGTVNKRGNVPNRGRRNGSRVVGDGMLGSSIEINRETSAACRPSMRWRRSQSLHSSDDPRESNPMRAKGGRKVDSQ